MDNLYHDINQLFHHWDKLATIQYVCISFIIKKLYIELFKRHKNVEKDSLYHISTVQSQFSSIIISCLKRRMPKL